MRRILVGLLVFAIVLIVASYGCVGTADTRVVQSPFTDPIIHTWSFVTGKSYEAMATPFGILALTSIDIQSIHGRTLLLHEAIHCHQMNEHGLLSYQSRYTYEWIRYGYDDISFEKEAHQMQQLFATLMQTADALGAAQVPSDIKIGRQ